jgi:putative sterol carrier protein
VNSVTEIFDEVNRRLTDPAKVGSTTGAYLFNLSGDDGGAFHIVLKDGQGEAGAGAVDNPNTTISMSAGDFVGLATGKLDPTMAFMTGKLKVRGDMALAMKLQNLLQ